jgi:hypothetical protein
MTMSMDETNCAVLHCAKGVSHGDEMERMISETPILGLWQASERRKSAHVIHMGYRGFRV